MEPERKRKIGLILVVALAALGLAFSAELLRVHLTVATDPTHPFSCQINEQISCNRVALSPQAVLLGVPVPVWGLLTYLVFGVLGILGLKAKQRPFDAAGEYVLPLAAWSVIYSAYLAYVAAFVIKTLCIFCACLYIVNLGLLVAGFMVVSPIREYLSRRKTDWVWLLARPAAMGFVAGAVVMAIGVAGYLYYRSSTIQVEAPNNVELDVSDDPMIGFPEAPITIIEFSDYQCPSCRNMHPVISTLLKEYPRSIRIIYKNFPLNADCNSLVKFRMHEYACGAAAAAECALSMGKFPEYSEKLWTTEDLSLAGLLRIAAEVKLDTAAFQECLSDPGTSRKIYQDVNDGIKISVTATPTFLINGYKLSGYTSIEESRKIIESLLKTGTLPTTVAQPPK